jgi:hypothetical protein
LVEKAGSSWGRYGRNALLLIGRLPYDGVTNGVFGHVEVRLFAKRWVGSRRNGFVRTRAGGDCRLPADLYRNRWDQGNGTGELVINETLPLASFSENSNGDLVSIVATIGGLTFNFVPSSVDVDLGAKQTFYSLVTGSARAGGLNRDPSLRRVWLQYYAPRRSQS